MKKLVNKLIKKKFIPLDEFINIALYNKEYGYYMKKNPFGKKGDFVTSPLISNLFSEMVAIWCVSYWEYLKKPKKIILVELGPGDGSLCEHLLKTFKNFNKFYNSLEINLLEISDKLKKIQKNKIFNEKVKWIKGLDNINKGPIIFFGNEFFDSLAIKQFCRKKNSIFEKYVTLIKDKEDFAFVYKKIKKQKLKKLPGLNIISSNKITEYPIDAIKYLDKIIKKINRYNGSLLMFDYGYEKKNNLDTLQSINKHAYSNPLSKVGNSDITSHVNFKLLVNILKKNNLNVSKIVTQNEFLQKMGINERANIISKNMSFKEKTKLFLKLKRLLSPKEMGGLFKVLLAQKRGGNFSLGF